jgi:hypothetical protein
MNTGQPNNSDCLCKVGLEPQNFAHITKNGIPLFPANPRGTAFFGVSSFDLGNVLTMFGRRHESEHVDYGEVQNASFSATWICRESSLVELTTPSVLVPTVPAGCPRIGWLGILKNSDRKSSLVRSLKWNDFEIDPSNSTTPGRITTFRPLVPNR